MTVYLMVTYPGPFFASCMISLECPAELQQCIHRGTVPVTVPINTIYNYEQRNSSYLMVIIPCQWASWLIKSPEFSLSNDYFTGFQLGVQIMGGGDEP